MAIWRRVDGFDFTVFGLVFGAVPLRKVSPWLLMALRICKKGRGALRSPYLL